MKILIAGGGKVGITLLRKLSEEGYDLTLIDDDINVLNSNLERFDVMTVQGNCASMEVLKQAGVDKADLLIAVTGEDEINLLCCLTAHGMNKKMHTVARIRNPIYSQQIYAMRDIYGLSMIVNPERAIAKEIERNLKYPGFLGRDTFAKGRVELVELKVEADSILCNTALNDLGKVVHSKILVCAVKRNNKVEIPGGNFVLREGDRIFVSGQTDELTKLLKRMGILASRVKRVMLCGGGKVSFYLAEELLKGGMEVQIIEQDRERCVELASRLPKADVIHGDASNQLLLESEGIKNCDALVTLTGMDEMNMTLSLYGKTQGVKQIITKVGHMENYSLMDSLPVGGIASPRELCCNNIVQYVRAMENKTGAALTVYSIADGLAEASEFRVDEKTLHCGEKMKDLKLRKNVLVACISKHGKTEFVHGESVFDIGDSVIVVTGEDVVVHQLNDIFV